jgi:hypothetical protein
VGALCTTFHRLYALASAKLGRCFRCMGLSLTGAVAGWVVLAAAVYFWPAFPFAHLLALWPVSFTALWLLHIVTFAGRSTVREVQGTQQFPEITPATGPIMGRRQMAKVFASGLAFAAVVSVAAAAAEAAGNHCCGGSCGSCNSGFTCKPATSSSMCFFTIACGPQGTRGVCQKA